VLLGPCFEKARNINVFIPLLLVLFSLEAFHFNKVSHQLCQLYDYQDSLDYKNINIELEQYRWRNCLIGLSFNILSCDSAISFTKVSYLLTFIMANLVGIFIGINNQNMNRHLLDKSSYRYKEQDPEFRGHDLE